MALQGLYPLDIQDAPADADVNEYLAPLLAETELTDDAAQYARELTAGTWAKREQYDRTTRRSPRSSCPLRFPAEY